ncbi:hypothetical protein [Vibrio mediterranei]|uniref:hypothetical protein n=1 Tax=Vibrio mediterranei TaxID=689 RepID=UPI00406937F8
MTTKTKRFLYYTGGADSTLLLYYLIQLLKKNPQDQLVVVAVANPTMRSGQEDNINQAINLLCSMLVEQQFDKDASLLNRISVQIFSQTVALQEPITIKDVETPRGEKGTITLKPAKPNDHAFLSRVKSMVMQEVTVLSSVPHLIPYLSSSANAVYLGCCSSDLANESLQKIRQHFDLTFEIALQMNQHSSLEKELMAAGLEPYGRRGGVYMEPEWMPTLNTPLASMTKMDVIMQLHHLGLTSFVIDKPEDLLGYYSMKSGGDMMIATKVYHRISMLYGHPEDMTSYKEFLATDSVSFTKDGETVTVSPQTIGQMAQEEAMNLMMRGMRSM